MADSILFKNQIGSQLVLLRELNAQNRSAKQAFYIVQCPYCDVNCPLPLSIVRPGCSWNPHSYHQCRHPHHRQTPRHQVEADLQAGCLRIKNHKV
jgi:hypothetical protein